jgi:hypothetical protein
MDFIPVGSRHAFWKEGGKQAGCGRRPRTRAVFEWHEDKRAGGEAVDDHGVLVTVVPLTIEWQVANPIHHPLQRVRAALHTLLGVCAMVAQAH